MPSITQPTLKPYSLPKTPILLKTAIPAALKDIRPGSTLMSVMGYTNNYGEVSNFGVVFHVDYLKAVRKALNIWLVYQPKNDLERLARFDLMNSYSDTLKGYNPRAKSAHVYSTIKYRIEDEPIKGVKWHDNGHTVHFWGFLVHKTVLKPGLYSESNKDIFTITREKLVNLTQLSRFRQFCISDGRFESIGVERLTLTQRDLIRLVEN